MLINIENVIKLRENEDIVARICQLAISFNAHIFLSKKAYELLKTNAIYIEGKRMKCSSNVTNAIFDITIDQEGYISIDLILSTGNNPFYQRKEFTTTDIYLIA